MSATLNINNLAEIRRLGLQALKEALGPIGMIRFLQQYDNGYGNYTKEKYQHQNLTIEEIDIMLKERSKQ